MAARDVGLSRRAPAVVAEAVRAWDAEVLRRVDPPTGLLPLTIRRETLDGLPGPLTSLLMSQAEAVRQPVWSRGTRPTVMGHLPGHIGLSHLRNTFGEAAAHRRVWLDPDLMRTATLRGLDGPAARARNEVLVAGLAESDGNSRDAEAARGRAPRGRLPRTATGRGR